MTSGPFSLPLSLLTSVLDSCYDHNNFFPSGYPRRCRSKTVWNSVVTSHLRDNSVLCLSADNVSTIASWRKRDRCPKVRILTFWKGLRVLDKVMWNANLRDKIIQKWAMHAICNKPRRDCSPFARRIILAQGEDLQTYWRYIMITLFSSSNF